MSILQDLHESHGPTLWETKKRGRILSAR